MTEPVVQIYSAYVVYQGWSNSSILLLFAAFIELVSPKKHNILVVRY